MKQQTAVERFFMELQKKKDWLKEIHKIFKSITK
jgi:hypothetical protein